QAQRYLREGGTDQWQDGYPNEDVLRSDVERGRGWVFECEGRIAGYVCIFMDVEASYAHIDGRWLTEGENCAVVQRSMGGDDVRGLRPRRRARQAERARGHAPRQQSHEPPGAEARLHLLRRGGREPDGPRARPQAQRLREAHLSAA